MLKLQHTRLFFFIVFGIISFLYPMGCANSAGDQDGAAVSQNESAANNSASANEPGGEETAVAMNTNEPSSGGQKIMIPTGNADGIPLPPLEGVEIMRIYQQAPELVLADKDGNSLTLSDFEGKPLVLTFWAPQCDVCLKQMQVLDDALKEKGVSYNLLAISPRGSDNEKDALKKLEKAGINAIAGFDTDGYATTSAYQVQGVPFFSLISANQQLQISIRGLVNQKFATMNFIEMVEHVANGNNVERCELAAVDHTPEKLAGMVGIEPPPFRELDLDGNEQSNEFYKGFSRLLIVFWSPTCPHCRSELPRIELFKRELADKYNTKIISLVSLPSKEDDKDGKMMDATKKLLEMMNITFPTVPDYNRAIQEMYGVSGVPSAFLIDKDGTVAKIFGGEFPFTAEILGCILEGMDAAGKQGE